jgi:dienelactone hydrolase
MMFPRVVLMVVMAALVGSAHAQETVVFPEPSGEYQVGVASYPLVDEAREEVFTEAEGDKREVLVTVYYPAEVSPDAEPAPYAEGALRDLLVIPAEQADQVQTQVYAGVPAAEGSFPVLIFSPGMGALPVNYTSLLAQYASHGYIVAAMWHPYSTAVTVFPDGRVVYANEAGYLDPFLDPVASEAATQRIGAVWTADASFVLDQLEQFNNDDALLAGHLDLERVGIFGHSFGGATAAEAAYQDSRFKGAINMDGPLFGQVEGQALAQPFMAMFSTEWIITDEAVAAAGISREEYESVIDEYVAEYTGELEDLLNNSDVGYSVHLSGVAHFSFATDGVLFAPLVPEILPEAAVGTLSGERVVEVMSAYGVSFFDRHLKGEDAPLLDGESADFPEVEFEATSLAS